MTTTGTGVTAPRVVVAGGHSAGHIEPAMNFADALRRLEPTAEITALGTVRGLDTTLIPTLARHVLTAVAERRRFASSKR
jgi:UDP-N-acetylglucosamine--N-acetylmuramyl-(pentapeptide) pyrophosphoryl-undecaprenol N-acetylglucosamine transferase